MSMPGLSRGDRIVAKAERLAKLCLVGAAIGVSTAALTFSSGWLIAARSGQSVPWWTMWLFPLAQLAYLWSVTAGDPHRPSRRLVRYISVLMTLIIVAVGVDVMLFNVTWEDWFADSKEFSTLVFAGFAVALVTFAALRHSFSALRRTSLVWIVAAVATWVTAEWLLDIGPTIDDPLEPRSGAASVTLVCCIIYVWFAVSSLMDWRIRQIDRREPSPPVEPLRE
ncbi:MAG: hypothetical protein NW203_11595 [Hyphomonadaceae bacterium]|nr:hypothetical protein [Hyphomonadaceae bacterium]